MKIAKYERLIAFCEIPQTECNEICSYQGITEETNSIEMIQKVLEPANEWDPEE